MYYKYVIAARLCPEEYQQILDICKERKETKSHLIRRALRNELAKYYDSDAQGIVSDQMENNALTVVAINE